ncbi:MAG: hypothetical protein AAGG50_07230 [Bacteroidota bacterium]
MAGYTAPAPPVGTLAVLPVQGVPLIENRDEVTRALGDGIPDAVFAQFLRERLAEVLPSEGVFEAAVLAEAPEVTLEPRTLPRSVRLPLPPDGTPLALPGDGAEAAFALFLGNVQMRRGERQNNPNAGGGFERVVVMQADYVLWDVVQAQPAVAGRAVVEAGTSITNPVNRTFLERRTEELAEEVVRGTPFRR